MANEYTLADYERTADPLTKAVVRTWREASPILDMLKFKQSDQLTQAMIRFNALPSVPWRNIGDNFTQLKVEPDEVSERLYFMGGKIDVPYEYEKAASLINQRETQEEAIIKSMAFGFNEAFFINTPGDDNKALVGLWYRIKNDLGSGQYFDANLDISEDTAVTNAAHKFFDKVENLMDLVDGNPGDKVLFMGRTLYRRAQSLMRQSNLLATTKDQLGRQFMTYGEGGPKIIDAGYKYDQSTPILGDAENGITALTGGSDSSMYCVRFGEPYLDGWCQDMPMADDVGLTEDRVNYRTVVRFSPGLFFANQRSMSLAYGFTAA